MREASRHLLGSGRGEKTCNEGRVKGENGVRKIRVKTEVNFQ